MSGQVAERGRVCRPETFPRGRFVVGELHLVRARVECLLAQLSGIAAEDAAEEWVRVEEAARIARRALCAAVAAAPPLPVALPGEGELVLGLLRIDTRARRQWWGEAEFELTPLHHRLLAVMASDPFRVFGKDELLRLVWRRGPAQTNAVNTSVSRLRRALEAAGAPRGRFLLSLHVSAGRSAGPSSRWTRSSRPTWPHSAAAAPHRCPRKP